MQTTVEYRGQQYVIYSRPAEPWEGDGAFTVLDIQPWPESIEDIEDIMALAEVAVRERPVGSEYVQ